MLSLIPARFSVSVLFIVACFVSVAMGTSVAVSYTHLDVYKRQLLGCAILICATVLNLWLEVKYKNFLVKKDFILSIAVFLGALILTK